MGKLYYATKFTYLPRQDGQKDGNIGTWQLRASWGDFGEQIFNGTWADDQTLKTVDFGQITPVRYVALSVFSEAGDDRVGRASAAEFNMQLIAVTGDLKYTQLEVHTYDLESGADNGGGKRCTIGVCCAK
ncbi:MAG: hypothetical protein LQ344_003073 [Seirophora lacunosa]|nr:MAG: hypothetical protein LQ344_003073 [Seirophora lacunosa]